VALGCPADGRVARHIRHRGERQGKPRRAQPEARGGQRGLAARVARADYGNIIGVAGKQLHNFLQREKSDLK
jgi:hypothetical protein